jgi:AcrR family transcriptional regulator
VFWKHGFADGCLQELEKATGVNKSGLYAEFSGRDELFLESLRFYLDRMPQLAGTRVLLRDRPALDPYEQSLYDDLRNDRLGDRVRLEQERVQYQVVEEAVLALHR